MADHLESAASSAKKPTRSAEEVRAARKREVALGYRLFAAKGWGDLGDGHISARDPERTDCFWLLRYGVSYHVATVGDLVLVGPDGSVVEGEGPINVAGYFIHQPILVARPDAVSAAHVHTPWGTPFSAEVRPIRPVTQEACIFYEDHAIFDDEEVQIQSTEAGGRIADALGNNRAVILRNHGLLTVGDSVKNAVGSFAFLERVAESQMKARDAREISPEAARFAKSDLSKYVGVAGFASLVARYIGDPTVVD